MDTDFKIYFANEMFNPGSFKNFSGEFCVEEITSSVDTYCPTAPIKYNLDITNTGDAFLISGTASTSATTNCSRCLEQCTVDLQGKIDAFYLMDAPEQQRDADINEFEILPPDHEIDAGQLICSSLIVDAPLKPLCSEECKGICAGCGVNLNVDECKCDKNVISDDNPFAALAGLKFED